MIATPNTSRPPTADNDTSPTTRHLPPPSTTTTTITSSPTTPSSSYNRHQSSSSSSTSGGTTSQLFSRLGLTNPFASSKTATEDKNSRRKSSTRLLAATNPASPGFKMSRMWGGGNGGGGGRVKGKSGRRDSGGVGATPTTPTMTPPPSRQMENVESGGVKLYSCAEGSVEGSEDAVARTAAGGGGDGGGASGGRTSELKRSGSSGSLGKMLKLAAGKVKGVGGGGGGVASEEKSGSAEEEGKKASDDGEASAEGRANSAGSGGVGLSRSNAVTRGGHNRKGSWRSSWGFAGGVGLSNSTTDESNRNSANSTATHISFASTNATDGSVENVDDSSGLKGFRRRKTSSTLHGLPAGRALGLGFGASGLEMTPTDKKESTAPEDDTEKPNTHDGVFTTTSAVDTPTATSDDSDPATTANNNNNNNNNNKKKNNSVSSAAGNITRRIKIPRLKPNASSSSGDGAFDGRARSNSEGAGTFLAASAKLMRHRPFLNSNTAYNAPTNASTTALRGYSTSSESGISLPSAAAKNNGFAGGIGHPAGVTSRSSPNLLLLEDRPSSSAAAEKGKEAALRSGSSSSGGVVDAGSRTTAAWFSTPKARDPPPTLPALLPSEEYLLGEVFAPQIELPKVDGDAADGPREQKRSGQDVVLGEWGVGRGESEGQKGMKALERVLEHRRKVLASDREQGDGLTGDERTLNGGDQTATGSSTVRKGAAADLELAKEAEAGADEHDGDDEASVGEGVKVDMPPIESKRSESITPRPTAAQLDAAHDVADRGRSSLLDPAKRSKHDRVIPSQSSSIYSMPNASPPTPSDTVDPPGNGYAGNDYVKEIETELVDDRWVDYGPMNEVRAL